MVKWHLGERGASKFRCYGYLSFGEEPAARRRARHDDRVARDAGLSAKLIPFSMLWFIRSPLPRLRTVEPIAAED